MVSLQKLHLCEEKHSFLVEDNMIELLVSLCKKNLACWTVCVCMPNPLEHAFIEDNNIDEEDCDIDDGHALESHACCELVCLKIGSS